MGSWFIWPLQPSTVVGLGVLVGTAAYVATGDVVWAGVAAAVTKMLVPDNTGNGAVNVAQTIAEFGQAFGVKTPPASPKPPSPKE